MILYTCGQRDKGPEQLHPCGRAGHALSKAGYEYEIKTRKGYTLMPWTWGDRKSDRADVQELSGGIAVPILVLDDGEVISGSGTIAKWAKENPKPGA